MHPEHRPPRDENAVTDASPDTEPATCAYPGCLRPVRPSEDPGRPSVFCEDPEHTALTSFMERKRLQDE